MIISLANIRGHRGAGTSRGVGVRLWTQTPFVYRRRTLEPRIAKT